MVAFDDLTSRPVPHLLLRYRPLADAGELPSLDRRLVQENPLSQQTIATAGSASNLIALLKDGTHDAQAYALWSLSLSIDDTNQKTLLEEDGVQVMSRPRPRRRT